jgi:tetratricopeptide (TPR) repeat protein
MQTTEVTATGPAAFGVIAERFRRAGQPDKAVALCREGLEKFPEHLSARVTLGWSLLDMGEHQEAFDQLKRVLKRAPDNLAAIRGLAELHERGIGLVFDSLSEEPEPEPVAEPEALEDLDPIIEPEVPVYAASAAEPAFEHFDEPAPFQIEDVDQHVDDRAGTTEAGSMFDLSGILDLEPAQAQTPATAPVVAIEPARVDRPISTFDRAPLALRDERDLERVGELQEWLSRVRGRRSDSVSQYMAG